MRSARIICPNGHLGFAPLKRESFRLGVAARPDFIAADSGSDDVGPGPLGADVCTSPRQWQTHDLEGLNGRGALTEDELDVTTRIVAMAGAHPFRELLAGQADVIIGGRSSDAAIFAACALHRGHSEALSYYLGKVLECASFCAEPY